MFLPEILVILLEFSSVMVLFCQKLSLFCKIYHSFICHLSVFTWGAHILGTN